MPRPVRVRMPLGNQIFDHVDHRLNELGRAGHFIGVHRPQRAHVVQVPVDRLVRAFVDKLFQRTGGACFLAGQRGGVDLIIYVGEVAHIGHVVRPIDMAQQAIEHVKHHHGARVTQMGAVIHRRPTDIHADVFFVDRREILLRPRHRVVKLDIRHVVLASLRTRVPAADLATS